MRQRQPGTAEVTRMPAGEWNGGLFEGYGAYQYGPIGAYAFDT